MFEGICASITYLGKYWEYTCEVVLTVKYSERHTLHQNQLDFATRPSDCYNDKDFLHVKWDLRYK